MLFQTKDTLIRPDWRVIGLMVAIVLVIGAVLVATFHKDLGASPQMKEGSALPGSP